MRKSRCATSERTPRGGCSSCGTRLGPQFVTSVVTQDGMRLVGFFERADLIRCELHLQGMKCVLQMLEFAGADDGSGDTALPENPGERDLRIVHAALAGDLRNAIDHIEV